MDISEVNRLSHEDFIARFGNVIENCGLGAAAVAEYRPYRNVDHLANVMAEFIDQLPLSGKRGILRLHPDLAGRLARAGELTEESKREQKAAGLDTLTKEEADRISELNTRYKDKFGFPFVICARQNRKEAILTGLETRLGNSGDEETLAGVNEVKKICYLRLLDIVDKSSMANL